MAFGWLPISSGDGIGIAPTRFTDLLDVQIVGVLQDQVPHWNATQQLWENKYVHLAKDEFRWQVGTTDEMVWSGGSFNVNVPLYLGPAYTPPTSPTQAAPKQYVDDAVAAAVGVQSFTDLDDTPGIYSDPLALYRVNNTGDGVEESPIATTAGGSIDLPPGEMYLVGGVSINSGGLSNVAYTNVTNEFAFVQKYVVQPTFTDDLDIVSKKYVDDSLTSVAYVNTNNNFSTKQSYSTPQTFTLDTDIVDKKYVDDSVSSVSGDITNVENSLNNHVNDTSIHFTDVSVLHNNRVDIDTGDFLHLTLLQRSGLTGGLDTSLHFHAADRDRANHTGTQPASTISDFDIEVSNNTDVATNTTHRGRTDNPHGVTATQVGIDSLDDIPDGTTYVRSENNYTDAEKAKLAGIDVANIAYTNLGNVFGPIQRYAVHPTFTNDLDMVDKKYVDDVASGLTTNIDNHINNATIHFTDASVLHNNRVDIDTGDFLHLTLIQRDGLTGGLDTSLHFHASDRNRSNHTGTQPASTISNFDVEVSNNTDVAANTAHRNRTDNPHNVTATQVGIASLDDIPDGVTYVRSENNYTDVDKAKLDGIDAANIAYTNLSNSFTQIQRYSAHPTFSLATDIVDKKYVDDVTQVVANNLSAHINNTAIHFSKNNILLGELGNVDTTGILDGQTIIYDFAQSKFVAGNVMLNTVWGGITGTLSDQTDLQAALDSKADDVDLTNHVNDATIHFTDASVLHNNRPDIDTGSYRHLNPLQKTDLTDGGNTSLHFHLSDRDRSNHVGTQLASTVADFDLAVENNPEVVSNIIHRFRTDNPHNVTASQIGINNLDDIPDGNLYVRSENNYTDAEKSKLDGIEPGAEVNVQSDWLQTNTLADDFIKNKPVIPVNSTDLADSADLARLSTANVFQQLQSYTVSPVFSNPTDIVDKAYVDSVASVGATWGSITGTLSDQTDLQAALSSKADKTIVDAHINDASIHFTDQSVLHNNRPDIDTGNFLHLSAVQKTDLTDGGNTSLHFHVSDRDRANHTGTQPASTISDFDLAVENNTEVLANTAKRHDPVTVVDTATVNLTLSGQEISADVIPGNINHNDTGNKQGGAPGEYYHLNLSDWTKVTSLDPSNIAYVNVDNMFQTKQSYLSHPNFTNDTDIVDKKYVDDVTTPLGQDLTNLENIVNSHINNSLIHFTDQSILHNNRPDIDSGNFLHLSASQKSELTAGGDTSLHFHASDRDRTSHTGTQAASTISDFDIEVSNNTDVATNTAHRGLTNNPHNVTASQVGLNSLDDIPDGSVYVRSENNFTDADKNKLDGIEPGAEVNVNADWNAISGDAEILNKPADLTNLSLYTWDQLSDVDYTGRTDGQVAFYNATSGNIEFKTLTGSTAWGSIVGTLSDQTDLQNALNGKVDLSLFNNHVNDATIHFTDQSVLHNNRPDIDTGSYRHLNPLQKTDLTDGGDTSLHFHEDDRDRANHTGVQPASTISDFDIEVANNPDVSTNTTHRGLINNPHNVTASQVGIDDLDDIPDGTTYVRSENNFSDADKAKLDSIDPNAEENVQSDWLQVNNTADDFIKNKPVIPVNSTDLADSADLARVNNANSFGPVQSYSSNQTFTNDNDIPSKKYVDDTIQAACDECKGSGGETLEFNLPEDVWVTIDTIGGPNVGAAVYEYIFQVDGVGDDDDDDDDGGSGNGIQVGTLWVGWDLSNNRHTWTRVRKTSGSYADLNFNTSIVGGNVVVKAESDDGDGYIRLLKRSV